MNGEALAALSKHPDVYANGGELVHVVHVVHGPDGSARIAALKDGLLQEFLSASAHFSEYRMREEGVEEVEVHPPKWTIAALSQRGNYPSVRALQGVVYHPVIRPDGSLTTVNGYDAATRLYIASTVAVHVTEHPSQADADNAVATLFDVVEDFPFAARPHFAAWLAGLLTPLCRAAFNGVAPGFHVEGNSPGVGKGMLVDVGAIIRKGHPTGVSSYSDEPELRKLITSAFRMGKTELDLDNITGKFGDGALNRLITGLTWEDRTLGANEVVAYQNRMTIYSTGNNCLFDDDSTRRFNVIRLQTELERPEDRQGFRYPNLIQHVREHRGELLSAALTIVRAYIVAGRPPQPMQAWGSFEGWNELVRGAVIFAGCSDPAQTRIELQEQAGTSRATAKLFAAELHKLSALTHRPEGKTDSVKSYPDGLTTRDIIDRIGDDVRAALEQCVHKGDLTPRNLGAFLRRFTNRRVGEYVIKPTDDRVKGAIRWTADYLGVASVASDASLPIPTHAMRAYACHVRQEDSLFIPRAMENEASEASEATHPAAWISEGRIA